MYVSVLSTSSWLGLGLGLRVGVGGRIRVRVGVRVRVRASLGLGLGFALTLTPAKTRAVCWGPGTVRTERTVQYVQHAGPWGQAALRLWHVPSAGGWDA
jgi:hypothetical protein